MLIAGAVGAVVLFVGIGAAASAGKSGNGASSAPTTVTVTAPPSTVISTAPAVTVTVTAPPPAPVTVTAQADAPTEDPAGPKDDGSYLVGAEIAVGNWKCEKSGDTTFWTVHTASNDIVDNGFSSVATITDEGFSAELSRCGGSWTKVG
jgi:hypothetical protein